MQHTSAVLLLLVTSLLWACSADKFLLLNDEHTVIPCSDFHPEGTTTAVTFRASTSVSRVSVENCDFSGTSVRFDMSARAQLSSGGTAAGPIRVLPPPLLVEFRNFTQRRGSLRFESESSDMQNMVVEVKDSHGINVVEWFTILAYEVRNVTLHVTGTTSASARDAAFSVAANRVESVSIVSNSDSSISARYGDGLSTQNTGLTRIVSALTIAAHVADHVGIFVHGGGSVGASVENTNSGSDYLVVASAASIIGLPGLASNGGNIIAIADSARVTSSSVGSVAASASVVAIDGNLTMPNLTLFASDASSISAEGGEMTAALGVCARPTAKHAGIDVSNLTITAKSREAINATGAAQAHLVVAAGVAVVAETALGSKVNLTSVGAALLLNDDATVRVTANGDRIHAVAAVGIALGTYVETVFVNTTRSAIKIDGSAVLDLVHLMNARDKHDAKTVMAVAGYAVASSGTNTKSTAVYATDAAVQLMGSTTISVKSIGAVTAIIGFAVQTEAPLSFLNVDSAYLSSSGSTTVSHVSNSRQSTDADRTSALMGVAVATTAFSSPGNAQRLATINAKDVALVARGSLSASVQYLSTASICAAVLGVSGNAFGFTRGPSIVSINATRTIFMTEGATTVEFKAHAAITTLAAIGGFSSHGSTAAVDISNTLCSWKGVTTRVESQQKATISVAGAIAEGSYYSPVNIEDAFWQAAHATVLILGSVSVSNLTLAVFSAVFSAPSTPTMSIAPLYYIGCDNSNISLPTPFEGSGERFAEIPNPCNAIRRITPRSLPAIDLSIKRSDLPSRITCGSNPWWCTGQSPPPWPHEPMLTPTGTVTQTGEDEMTVTPEVVRLATKTVHRVLPMKSKTLSSAIPSQRNQTVSHSMPGDVSFNVTDEPEPFTQPDDEGLFLVHAEITFALADIPSLLAALPEIRRLLGEALGIPATNITVEDARVGSTVSRMAIRSSLRRKEVDRRVEDERQKPDSKLVAKYGMEKATVIGRVDCTRACHKPGTALARLSDDLTRCVCECKAQFVGDRCSECPAKYSGAACDKCADGLEGYPICAACEDPTAELHSEIKPPVPEYPWLGPLCAASPGLEATLRNADIQCSREQCTCEGGAALTDPPSCNHLFPPSTCIRNLCRGVKRACLARLHTAALNSGSPAIAEGCYAERSRLERHISLAEQQCHYGFCSDNGAGREGCKELMMYSSCKPDGGASWNSAARGGVLIPTLRGIAMVFLTVGWL